MKDDPLDFNFWPTFADLMLIVVILLVSVLVVIAAVSEAGTVDVREVDRKQVALVDALAQAFRVEPHRDAADRFTLTLSGSLEPDIIITNQPQLQRITFSERILFNKGDSRLKPEGKVVLEPVRHALAQRLGSMREIQIQGHADPDPIRYGMTNMQLAADRAISVFDFLREDASIDPASHLISVASYGEFKPVQRAEDDPEYTNQRLADDNRTEVLKTKNRRIELLLFYRVVRP